MGEEEITPYSPDSWLSKAPNQNRENKGVEAGRCLILTIFVAEKASNLHYNEA